MMKQISKYEADLIARNKALALYAASRNAQAGPVHVPTVKVEL